MDTPVDSFTAGRPVALSERVTRVLAPNASRMTGPGTNTYLVAAPRGDDVAILDAGPALTAHLDAIEAAVGGRRVSALVVTHTHADHSPAVAALRDRFGAPRVGAPSPRAEYQDPTFAADVVATEGTRVAGNGWTLVAVPTPGHASNHVCWYLEEERALFTGDHILGTVSPVILPPDGSMREYLDSLERLKSLPIDCLLPGHGPRLDSPREVIDALIRHRLAREARLVRALAGAPGSTVAELVTTVYADVPTEMHRWAGYSLLAHLIKLAEEGRAREESGRWYPSESAA